MITSATPKVQRPCWIKPEAICPHCDESSRLLGGPGPLRDLLVKNFHQRHFDNCKQNPVALAARKALPVS